MNENKLTLVLNKTTRRAVRTLGSLPLHLEAVRLL